MNSAALERLRAVVAAQEDHPVYPPFTVEMLAVMPPGDVLTLLQGREEMIRREREDPFRYGYEPPFWDTVDWALAERRAELPGVVLELLILGGNRAAKTEFAAKRSMAGLVLNKGYLSCLLHLDEGASRAVQQKRAWKYLPPEFKPESGRAKKTLTTRMNYNELSGFTENSFSLPNGSQCLFKFYSADVTSVEGLEFDAAWSDELVPLNWMEAMEYRLLTRAERTKALSAELRGVLRARAEGLVTKFPRELLPRLYQGVHIVTFTPIQGYTATVGRFLADARTLLEVPAELLPKKGDDGETETLEMVPRLQRGKEPNRLIAYFHTYDNKYGGNWEGMKAKLKSETRNKVRERAYGIPTSAFDTRFPLFSRESHVRPNGFLPKEGTWYHIVDPCPGRNFAMCWIIVNALGEGFVAREWPQQDDYIPGVGLPGEWAVPCPKGKKDGARGEAQKPFGFGIKSYKREIARVERELYLRTHPGAHPEHKRRIQPFLRIIDSRGGAAPSLAHESPSTLIEKFAEVDPDDPEDEPLYFTPSARSLTDEGGSTTINDGVELVNNLLFYDQEKCRIGENGLRIFDGAAPGLYVAASCENTIFALSTWTGADGQKGACKDFADLVRYFAQAGADYIPPELLRGGRGGGTF